MFVTRDAIRFWAARAFREHGWFLRAPRAVGPFCFGAEQEARRCKPGFSSLLHHSSCACESLQVNGIAFHPVHGTLATVGSDGRFSFWDKDARTKLKTSEQLDQPIAACCFNHNGNIFAYASSYDWSKGHEFYNPQKKNYIFLRNAAEELKPRNKK